MKPVPVYQPLHTLTVCSRDCKLSFLFHTVTETSASCGPLWQGWHSAWAQTTILSQNFGAKPQRYQGAIVEQSVKTQNVAQGTGPSWFVVVVARANVNLFDFQPTLDVWL